MTTAYHGLGAAGAILLALWAPTATAAQAIDERLAADSAGQVQVINTAGEVIVSGWDQDEVHVTGTLGRGVERLDFSRDGKHTIIRVVLPDGRNNNVGSTDLKIRIPAASGLSVNAVSADIEVRGVRGVQRLETVSGDIEAEAIEDDLEAKTVSGDIDVSGRPEAPDSLVTVTTVSGDAEVRQVAGEVEASAVSGDIVVTAQTLARARLKTTSGNVRVSADLAPDSRLDVETINGDIDVVVADASHLSVDVETFNGGIENCFGEQSQRKSKYGPGRFLRFSRGDGDRDVQVQALNGDVEICDS